MKQLQSSIFTTLLYHDIFEYPLKEQEVYKLLVQTPSPKHQIPNKFKFPKSQIQNNLKILVRKKKILKKGGFYFLPGRRGIINLRKKREKYSQDKIKIAEKTVRILKFIPWIKMIGVTGALAMNNSEKDDDIDFLIITTKNRLWLTRLLMLAFLEILGKRRKAKDEIFKNKICPNLLLDEFTLRLAQGKQNLFTAHEIMQMRPIFNRDSTYEKFLLANKWVKEYLPNSLKKLRNYGPTAIGPEIKKLRKNNNKTLNISISQYLNISNFFEKLAYNFQSRYMKSKQTKEQISLHSAFFHPKDRGKEILKEYNRRLRGDFLLQ